LHAAACCRALGTCHHAAAPIRLSPLPAACLHFTVRYACYGLLYPHWVPHHKRMTSPPPCTCLPRLRTAQHGYLFCCAPGPPLVHIYYVVPIYLPICCTSAWVPLELHASLSRTCRRLFISGLFACCLTSLAAPFPATALCTRLLPAAPARCLLGGCCRLGTAWACCHSACLYLPPAIHAPHLTSPAASSQPAYCLPAYTAWDRACRHPRTAARLLRRTLLPAGTRIAVRRLLLLASHRMPCCRMPASCRTCPHCTHHLFSCPLLPITHHPTAHAAHSPHRAPFLARASGPYFTTRYTALHHATSTTTAWSHLPACPAWLPACTWDTTSCPHTVPALLFPCWTRSCWRMCHQPHTASAVGPTTPAAHHHILPLRVTCLPLHCCYYLLHAAWDLTL